MAAAVKKALFPVAGTVGQLATMHASMEFYNELRVIVDKPIIQFAVEECKKAGIEEFIFVTCSEKSALEDHLSSVLPANSDLMATASKTTVPSGEAIFVRQAERRGIGHAIWLTRELIEDEPFAVIIPNLLVLGEKTPMSEMVAAYEAGGVLIGAARLEPEPLSRFGVLDFDPDSNNRNVRSVVEKPAPGDGPSDSAAFGRWILPPEAFEALETLTQRHDEEVSLTDCINSLIGKHPVKALPIEGSCYDLREKSGLVKATVAYALENPDFSPAVTEAYAEFVDAGVRTMRSIALTRRYEDLTSLAILAQIIENDFRDEIALVSSFGADSAVLLHLLSRVDQNVPVLFVDTGKLFQKTQEYRQNLTNRLGLTNVQAIGPRECDLQRADPTGQLHLSDPDACCHMRKTLPLERALDPFKAWITGRKRFQSTVRAKLPLFEEDGGGRIKINPLATWERSDLARYVARYDLTSHPLVADGYPSIGCEPCTSRVKAGEDERAGRWRGREKTECGIHIVDGKVQRLSSD